MEIGRTATTCLPHIRRAKVENGKDSGFQKQYHDVAMISGVFSSSSMRGTEFLKPDYTEFMGLPVLHKKKYTFHHDLDEIR